MLDFLARFALRTGYRALRIWWQIRRPVLTGSYVAVWHGDRLLLIRNSYKSGETLPCGGLKRGETHRGAARRELKEEVGIEVEERQLVFACEIEVEGPLATDRAHFFELEVATEPTVEIDHREVVWAGFFPLEELDERPLIRSVRAYLERRSAAPASPAS